MVQRFLLLRREVAVNSVRHAQLRFTTLCLVRWASRALGCALLEAILEFAWNQLHRSHAAGAGRLSPLRLLTPVVCSA